MARRDKYSRLSRAGKLRRLDLFPLRTLFRCRRCHIRVEDRDRASHLERCAPDVIAAEFKKDV